MESEPRAPANDAMPSPIDWPRVCAFHLPVLLIGGIAVMPLIYLYLSESGALDSDLANFYFYTFREQPLRAVLLGLVALGPSVYAFGTKLKFSLGRYLGAVVVLAVFTLLALQSAFRSGYSGPMLIGPFGGVLSLVVTFILGFAGLAAFDALASALAPEAAARALDPSRSSRVVKLLAAIAAAALVGALWQFYRHSGPIGEYSGLRLGMTEAEVIALKGQPFAVGNPSVAMLPDGSVVALSRSGVPMEQDQAAPSVPRDAQARAARPLSPEEAGALGKAMGEAAAKAERAPLTEKHKIVRQLNSLPSRPNGWKVFPDLTVTANPVKGDYAAGWFYEAPDGKALTKLEFDGGSHLSAIWCLALQPSGCPALRNVRPGMDEAAVRGELGHPSLVSFSPRTRAMRYRLASVWIYLNEQRVYLLGLESAHCSSGRCE